MKLYGYWRSSAAYRVRIAVGLKGLEVEHVYVDLARGEQQSEEYGRLNPQRIVPTLVDDEVVVAQSLAIIEYLEEKFPEPRLLPTQPAERARVRSLAQIVACEMHPVNTIRLHGYLEKKMGVDEEHRKIWYRDWIARGFAALEARLASEAGTGRFCHGDSPGMADCCLVPQVYNARLNDCDLAPYPTIRRIEEACLELPAFRNAAPEVQPDYPG